MKQTFQLSKQLIRSAVLLMALAPLAGCTKTPPPQFHLDMVNLELSDVKPDFHQEIADSLGAMFGTPDEPFVLPESGLSQAKVDLAAGPVHSNQLGKQRGLYRQ